MVETKYLLVLAIIVIVGVYLFYFSSSKEKTSTVLSKYDVCTFIEPLAEEISCQKAIDAALERYPGEVAGIKRNVINMPQPPDFSTTAELQVWSIDVNLNQITDISNQKAKKVRVDVDRASGHIRMITPLELVA